ncbi:MAG: glycosyltransferase involved in cell wall biosynthesis [Granulosicoccus sp.]|jgi:glycosyltransferase involved in cell wall biosynthesis
MWSQRLNSGFTKIPATTLSPVQARLRAWVKKFDRIKPAKNQAMNNPGSTETVFGERPTPADHANSIRYFANPGPDFENRCTPDTPAKTTVAKAIAFYLPQFHTFEQNDAWWGAGFTEWRNVSRGTPRFQGHYQPRIPRDLGFYDLSNVGTLKAQAALARAAGIEAFCFYYYWFNGKRLMDKPLDLFAESDIDQEFCIMWANENWTRRWDGREDDVLIAQDYSLEDEDDFLADTAKYMTHPRYTQVQGRPLFILYRASLIPDTAETLTRWREKWASDHGVQPIIYMVQSYLDRDPYALSCDGAIEFPPHKVSRDLKRRNREHLVFDNDYEGQIRAYGDVVAKSLNEPAPDYPLIKTVSPSWDNDARREGNGVTLQGSTPTAYREWLTGAVDFAINHPVDKEPLVFINAWNEWAEAAYLEPDVHYGHAYLNATYRVLKKSSETDFATNPRKLLLVGHDAHANGAQMLLLALARYYTTEMDLDIEILLKAGGALLPQYQAVAPTTVLEDMVDTNLAAWFSTTASRYAIFNTSVTGDLLSAAKAANVVCLSLVHELPALITDFKLQPHIHAIAELADHVVFPSTLVRSGFEIFEPVIRNTISIHPQGLYKNIKADDQDRDFIRKKLGMLGKDTLVLNAGYADHRKGFDCFASAAARIFDTDQSLHFCWVGKRSKAMSKWLKSNIDKKRRGRLHLIDFTDDISPWFAAADCLYLSSREDPFPSVALEALSLGTPVVVHKGATGFDSELLELMEAVAIENHAKIDNAILNALQSDTPEQIKSRQQFIEAHYRLEDYAKKLVQLLGLTSTTDQLSVSAELPVTRALDISPDICL